MRGVVSAECRRFFCMAKTREQKQEEVRQITDRASRQNGMVFVDYSGLSVKEMQELRSKLNAQEAQMLVAKKTLLQRVFGDVGIEMNPRELDGQLGVVFAMGDPVAAIKETSEYAKGRESMQILGGYMERQVLDAPSVQQVAQLPSKDQLRAQLVGTMAAPVSGFATVLQGNISGLVRVLSRASEK